MDHPDAPASERTTVGELAEVLADVRMLAERRGWTDVAEQAAGALQPPGMRSAVLTAPDGIDTAPLQQWLTAREGDAGTPERGDPTQDVVALALEELARDALFAAMAERVVAIFECGRLLTAEDVDAVAGALFSRPATSYAIVFAHAERIAHEDDLDLIERGAWRLLVPDEMGDWNGQDLRAHRIVLWSAAPSEAPPFLRNRLHHDAAVLSAWWGAPLPPDAASGLACRRVLALIELAERIGQRELVVRADAAQTLERQRIVDAVEALGDLRGKLTRRIDTDIAAVERQLILSLQVLETDLLAGLTAYLEQQLAATDARTLQQAVTRYIAVGTARWRRSAEDLLRTGTARVAADVDTMLAPIDWAAVNAVVARQGDARTYPDALSRSLLANSQVVDFSAGGVSPLALPQFKGTGSPATVIGGVMVGSVVTAAAAFLLLTGPVGLVVAGALGATGGGLLGQRAQRENVLRATEPPARLAVSNVIRETVSRVHSHARQTTSLLRERTVRELNSLAETLDAARDGGGGATPVSGTDRRDADRELLVEARRRVQELLAAYG